MKLTIPRGPLHAALTQAARVVERRNTIPILSNVSLATGDGWLHLRATDLDIEISLRVAATVDVPGETTVPAHTLATLVGKLDDGPVRIEALADNATVTVVQGRSRTRLQCLPALDYPDLTGGDPTHRFGWSAADLVAAHDATAFAISTEETRYYLNGVHLNAAETVDGSPRIAVVATDGHRLGRWRGPLPDGAAGMPGVIVPRKTVGEIRKIAAEGIKGGHETVAVALSDAKISFEIGDTLLTSKLIDGTFPDYGRVIPIVNTAEAMVDAAELDRAVDRVSTVSAERGRAVKLAFADEVLRLTVDNPDAGSGAEEIPVRTTAGTDFALEIGFNARYLRDVIGAIGGDTIVARLPPDPGSPTIFVPEPAERDGRDRLVVLMPMRV